MVTKPLRLCLLPRLTGVGGMVSFQHKFAAGLLARGVQVCYDVKDTPYQAILVIGGTRNLAGLWQARRRGVRIVQRLDGMNWLHRKLPTGLRHYLRAEYGNLLLATIRSHFADFIVYQSQFTKNWWERQRGALSTLNHVIYNGVDLNRYSPRGMSNPSLDRWRVLMVEGSLMGGYEIGLQVAINLVEGLNKRYEEMHPTPEGSVRKVELMVVGRVSEEIQSRWSQRAKIAIQWAGEIPPERVPEIDRAAHLLYSADLNPACPNSVIEALACGLPVLAFDTGALTEMVTGDAGCVVAYGGDPWNLDPPDLRGLVHAGFEILSNQDSYRMAARKRAEEVFDLDRMVQSYLDVLVL